MEGNAIKTKLMSGVASFGLLCFCGCLVGPKYRVPTAPVPSGFKEGPPPGKTASVSGWTPANPADGTVRGDWWLIFSDAQLNVLEPQVASANQALKVADANLRAARAAIQIRNADRYPTIGIAPILGGERDSANQPYFNSANANNGVANLLLPLQASYEIDLWGSVRRNIAAAKEEFQASVADRQNILLSLQAELAIDYFELRAADAQQKILNDTVTQYKEALRVTTNRFEGGVAVKSDVTQAQTQLQTAKVAAADVAISRAQYEHAIAILAGQPPSSLNLQALPLSIARMPPVVPSGLPSDLLERRPDIAAAERRVAEANQQIGIARAAFFPTVALTGSAGFESTSIGDLFTPSSVVYAIGPALSETFFDGGRRRGVSQQAQAEFDRAASNYRQIVLTSYQQVEDNLVALRILADEAEQQRDATAAAQESERIFNNRYVGGVDTYLQVITSQTSALNNERNDVDILRRRMDATVLLIKVLGGGWDRGQLPKP